MKAFIHLIVLAALVLPCATKGQQKPKITVSVLSIGNQYYPNTTDFRSIPGINLSAQKFLDCFKSFSTPCILLSSNKIALTKNKILSAIKSFVGYVEKQPGEANIGIIYYCGHGIASQTGSRYFVPGDIDISIFDTTYESLSDKLINIDSIKHLVIDAQNGAIRSQYILMGDCCSEQDFSKWYNGIRYHYTLGSKGTAFDGVIQYNDTAIKNMMAHQSMLQSSAALTFDSFNDTSKNSTLSSGTTEMTSIGELIRTMTFSNRGNLVYYSSAINRTSEMAKNPFPTAPDQQVAPICRRTLLYFKNRPTSKQFLDEYFRKLTEKDFDIKTLPALRNPSMNPDEQGSKQDN